MIEFKPRAMMERAIAVMQQSVAETRKDGKATPKVGAVLRFTGDETPPGGRIVDACRGELREGDHAEFTLLERKCRDRRLDDCVLFATLEPCAPGARKDDKLSCAERIVLARIKKVWVGIEDPDPTVDRKGIKYLQDHGVEVNMFDRDLQDEIREENKDFIAQALERAAAVEEAPREIVLSKFESISSHAQRDDFDRGALIAYASELGVSDDVHSEQFNRRLLRQGLLKETDQGLQPTGFGMLLLGRNPRECMPQAGLLGTIHFPDGSEDVKDFVGPQIFAPRQAIQWLREKLPNIIDRTEAQRKQKSETFFELVREGIVNAIVHRDYGIEQAKCQLRLFPEKVEVMSPGAPVEPITLEQLQLFEAPMLSRNPILHYVFAQMGLAEERGLGLKSMREKALAAGLPRPRYAWQDPYVVLTLYPSSASATKSLAPSVLEKLSEAEATGWSWLATKGCVKAKEYAESQGVDARTARRHMKRFIDLGLVRVLGSGPSTEYEVI